MWGQLFSQWELLWPEKKPLVSNKMFPIPSLVELGGFEVGHKRKHSRMSNGCIQKYAFPRPILGSQGLYLPWLLLIFLGFLVSIYIYFYCVFFVCFLGSIQSQIFYFNPLKTPIDYLLLISRLYSDVHWFVKNRDPSNIKIWKIWLGCSWFLIKHVIQH